MISLDQQSLDFYKKLSSTAQGIVSNYLDIDVQDLKISDIEPVELRSRIAKLYGDTLINSREKIEDLLSLIRNLAEIRQLHDQFCIPRRSVRLIADSLGLSRNGIYDRLKRLGLTTEQVSNPNLSVLDLAKLSTTLGEKTKKIDSVLQDINVEEVPLPDLTSFEYLCDKNITN